MTHVFVAPHPDDVALSCGGLIAGLRELGQNVTILTVFSGNGSAAGLTQYQREALGFGNKAVWPTTEAFNRENIRADQPLDADADAPYRADSGRLDATQAEADAAAKRFWQRSSWYRRADIHNRPQAGQALMDDVSQQGAVLTTELVEAKMAGDLMAARRLEDERYAYFAEASIVFLDLPDAVFRGYEGDEQLLGRPSRRRPGPDRPPGEGDRPPGAAEGLPAAGDRRSRRPPAHPRGRRRAPGAGPPLGDARPGVRRDRHLLRGLPVRLVERLPAPRRPARQGPSPGSRRTSASRRSTPTSPRRWSARSRA